MSRKVGSGGRRETARARRALRGKHKLFTGLVGVALQTQEDPRLPLVTVVKSAAKLARTAEKALAAKPWAGRALPATGDVDARAALAEALSVRRVATVANSWRVGAELHAAPQAKAARAVSGALGLGLDQDALRTWRRGGRRRRGRRRRGRRRRERRRWQWRGGR
eukprot:scaffold118861_cov22-Tisochrysis_lutea.AAC.2